MTCSDIKQSSTLFEVKQMLASFKRVAETFTSKVMRNSSFWSNLMVLQSTILSLIFHDFET